MSFDQFMACLPLLGLEFGKAKSKEIRYLLKEIKQVILYPEVNVREQIKVILDEYDPKSFTSQAN